MKTKLTLADKDRMMRSKVHRVSTVEIPLQMCYFVILCFPDSGIWNDDQRGAERPAAGHRVQSDAGAYLP